MKRLFTHNAVLFFFFVAIVLSLAACQNAEELYNKGMLYINGEGVEKNIEKGLSFLKQSAQKGNLLAVKEVADVLYSQGDVEEAIIWYNKSIQAGDASSARMLGYAYMYGDEHVKQDYVKSVQYNEKAIELEQNQAAPYFLLGICYYLGHGVNIDYSKAAEYFRRGADLNDPLSLYNLGICYMNGKGVLRDQDNALVYIKKAADLGQEDAINYLDEMEREWERQERERDILDLLLQLLLL